MSLEMAGEGDGRPTGSEGSEDQRESGLPESIDVAEKMEALGRFAGGLAHSLNNVFAVILSNAQFGLRELDKDHALHEDLQDIVAAARRGVDLVDELRSVGGRQALRPKEIDLNEVLGGMHSRLVQAAGEKVKIVVSLEGDEMLIRADRDRIEQVILRLVENARDSMPDGGKLSISTERMPRPKSAGVVGERMIGVALIARDTGEGINRDSVAKAFDPYYSSGRTVKPSLGLAAAHGIITQSGGHMDVKVDPSGGTVFRAWLPSARGGC
jgi:two-component system cell cycle sensor histidine kinase/response regulator CckA